MQSGFCDKQLISHSNRWDTSSGCLPDTVRAVRFHSNYADIVLSDFSWCFSPQF